MYLWIIKCKEPCNPLVPPPREGKGKGGGEGPGAFCMLSVWLNYTFSCHNLRYSLVRFPVSHTKEVITRRHHGQATRVALPYHCIDSSAAFRRGGGSGWVARPGVRWQCGERAILNAARLAAPPHI